MWETSLISSWPLIWPNPSCHLSSSWLSCHQPAKTFFHRVTRWHTLHVLVTFMLVWNLSSFTDSVSFTASDDITELTHCWVLPTRLQNGPEWQTAGVGGCGAHPVYRRGALNICILCVSCHNICAVSALSWYVCVCVQKCLLAAMEPYTDRLTPSEKARNRHTECAVYCFDKELDYAYSSSLPQLFPNIVHCHARYVLSPTLMLNLQAEVTHFCICALHLALYS